MDGKFWFGIPGIHMAWVPCPQIDSVVQKNRYIERIQFENGGGDMRRSPQYQMEYQINILDDAHTTDGVDVYNKFASGFYGDGLIYMAYPPNFQTNMFPAAWATPALIEQGWANIASNVPSFGPTNVAGYGQPTRTATWNITDQAGTYTKSVKIAIPPTHTLWMGVSGLATGTAVVSARPINADGSYAAVQNLTLLSKSGSTRMNVSFSGASYQAVEFYITRTRSEDIVYTNLVTNPSFESTTGSNVTVRTNLVTNPSFETGNTGWSIFGAGTGGTHAISTEQAKSGSYSDKVTINSASEISGDIRQGGLTSFPFGIAAGNTYTISAWVYTPAVHTTFSTDAASRQRRILYFYSIDGTSPVAVFGAQATNIVGWQRITHTFTVPSNAVGVVVGVGCAGSPTDTSFVTYVDAVQLEVGATASTYFDGDSPNSFWNGTPHASTSNTVGGTGGSQWVQVKANSALEASILTRLSAVEARDTKLEAANAVRVSSQSERTSVYPSPVQGNTVFRADLGYEEKYYAAYNATTNPDGTTGTPGWYQYAGGAPLSQNYIINGGFDIWQRGTAIPAYTNVFVADRWKATSANAPSMLMVQGSANITGNPGLKYALSFQSQAVSPYAGTVSQTFESDVVEFIKGKTITMSFYLATPTGTSPTVTALIENSSTADSSTATFTTLASRVISGIGTGFTRYSLTAAIPNASSYNGLRFSFSVSGTSSYETRLTGIQIEEGPVATPFRRNQPNIQAELAACQRYYQLHESIDGSCDSNGWKHCQNPGSTLLRANPTSAVAGNVYNAASGSSFGTNVTLTVTNKSIMYSQIGANPGAGAWIGFTNVAISAEL